MTKTNAQPRNRNGLVAALDVGSTKTCCLIARIGEFGPRIVGIGHQVSEGMRSGAVVDMNALEASIRATVETAEQMAGENIRDVYVSLSSASVRSHLIAYEISTAGHQIDEADVRRVLDPGAFQVEETLGRERLQALPVGYSIDGNRGVRDPIGMYGDRLAVSMHVITASSAALRNLETVVARCHLGIAETIVSPQAAALSCLVGDETSLGVTLVELGGGTTSIAVFFDGEIVHVDVVPVGGQHITSDIARGLSTPIGHAERIKTLFGNAMPSSSDDRAVIEVPLIGEDGGSEANQVPRSMLVGIIRPRIEETFELVRDRLAKAGFERVTGPRVVLTGGAAQLPGIADVAASVLDKQVRLARPRPVEGMAEAISGPAFSTCVGLLNYAAKATSEVSMGAYRPMEDQGGRLGRLGQWFRENF